MSKKKSKKTRSARSKPRKITRYSDTQFKKDEKKATADEYIQAMVTRSKEASKLIFKKLSEVDKLTAQVRVDHLAFSAVINLFAGMQDDKKTEAELQTLLDRAKEMIERALRVGEPHVLWMRRMKNLLIASKALLQSDIENTEEVRRLRFAVKKLGG